MVTHFFNPPRYMQLLETVPGPTTRPDAVDAIEAFADVQLGKAVVRCNDTPGFVANRLGVYWIATAIGEALARGLTVEETDLLMGEAIGAPRTGVFGLMDLVGLGLHEHVTASLDRLLPESDAWHDVPAHVDLFRRMVAMGATGRASGKGFYARDGAQRLAVDLETLEYRPAAKPRLDAVAAARAGGLPALVATTDRYGDYAKMVLTKVLDYAAAMVPEVTDQPALIDLAMERGFNWKHGPFHMIEQLGGPPAPTAARRPGVLLLSDLKARPALASNPSATLWDAGDDVAGLEFHTKANAIDDGVLELIEQTVAAAGERFRALVIYNEGAFFSTGGNLAASADAGKRGRLGSGAPLRRAWPTRLRRPQVRTVAGDRRARRTRTRRRLRGALALRRGAGPHRDVHGPGRAGGGAAAGLGRLPRSFSIRATETSPGGPMPPAAKAFEVIGLTPGLGARPKTPRSWDTCGRAIGSPPTATGCWPTPKRSRWSWPTATAPPEPAHAHRRRAVWAGDAGADRAPARRHHGGRASTTCLLVGEYACVLTGGPDADPTRADPREGAVSELELGRGSPALIRRPQTLQRMEPHRSTTGKPLRN